MIYDKYERISFYKDVIPHIGEVVDYLSNIDMLEIPYNQRIDISRNAYMMRTKYYGKGLNEAVVESHLKYIDVHIVIKGKEMIYYGIAPENKGDHVGYDSANDVIKYEEYLINRLVLEPEQCVVFFKEDLHQPGIRYNDDKIDKLVIKIRCKEEPKEEVQDNNE